MPQTMDFLLYHKTTGVTGRTLAKTLRIPYGLTLPPTITKVETLIRWGSQMAISTLCQPVSTVNSIRAISTASDKLSTLEKLTVEGVSVPPFSDKPSTLNFPILGRSRRGSQAQDIRVYQEWDEHTKLLNSGHHDFYTEYVPNTREYRIHVVRGEIIRIQGKYLDCPDDWTNKYVKNYAQGFRFRAPDKELNSDRKDAAIKAVECLGLDFGAVDLIIGEDRETYILEVNTAPACSPMTLAAYVAKFRPLLNGNSNHLWKPPLRRRRKPAKVIPGKKRCLSCREVFSVCRGSQCIMADTRKKRLRRLNA